MGAAIRGVGALGGEVDRGIVHDVRGDGLDPALPGFVHALVLAGDVPSGVRPAALRRKVVEFAVLLFHTEIRVFAEQIVLELFSQRFGCVPLPGGARLLGACFSWCFFFSVLV